MSGRAERGAFVRTLPDLEAAPRMVAIEILDEALRPRWLAPGATVRFWSRRRPSEAPAGARPLAFLVDGDGRRPAIARSGTETVLLFDLIAAIEAITHETYLRPRRPLHSRLPLPYHVVPGWLRLRLFRWLVKAGRPREDGGGFPAWPIDASVETLRFVADRLGLGGRAAGAGRGSPRAGWPGGRRYAFAVSHDVDTAAGRDRMAGVAAMEEGLGVRATWFLLGARYALDHGFLDELRSAGHEIGLHGDRHDNRIAYVSPAAMERRLARCRDLVARQDVQGFRAPSLLESGRLRSVLARSFRYASQVPDTEVDSLVAPRRGCATCFPFRKNGLLEIPITLPMDDKLLLAGFDVGQVLDLWRRKIEWVKEIGGIAQLAVHAEPHLLDRSRGPIRAILEETAADGSAWIATLGEIARWWEEAVGA